MGELENTLIIYIAGDNGTSAEGGMAGLDNEMTYFNAEPQGSDIDFMLNAGAVRKNKVTVAETTLGGVPVLDVRPEGWEDNGKVLVYAFLWFVTDC